MLHAVRLVETALRCSTDSGSQTRADGRGARVTPEGIDVFLTDAGAEISVRTAHDTSTSTTTVEPLYAAELEVLDGVTGELRGKAGERVRGTLRRLGDVFALYPEGSQGKPKAASPSEASRAAWRAEFEERAQESAPSQAEAIEAAETVAQFLRDQRTVSVKAARQAQSIVSRFPAERERQARARDD